MLHVSATLSFVLLALPAAASPLPDPGATARAILTDSRYQRDLPSPAAPPTSEAQPAHVGTDAGREDVPRLRVPVVAGDTLATLFIVIAVAVALAVLLRYLPRRAAGTVEPPPPAVAPASPSRPRALDDPDVLARNGQFAEAIHALLLGALRELGRRAGSVAASPATTSREVLQSAVLAPETRAALRPLVTAVERVHFGWGQAGVEEYTSCLTHYR